MVRIRFQPPRPMNVLEQRADVHIRDSVSRMLGIKMDRAYLQFHHIDAQRRNKMAPGGMVWT